MSPSHWDGQLDGQIKNATKVRTINIDLNSALDNALLRFISCTVRTGKECPVISIQFLFSFVLNGTFNTGGT